MAPQVARSTSGLSLVLSLALGFFAVNAALGVLDDLMLATLSSQAFTLFRALSSLLMMPVTVVLFLMMAIWPGIPKRVFMIVVLFIPVATIVSLPLFAYFFPHFAWVSLAISVVQLLTALLCVLHLRGSKAPTWPLVSDASLGRKIVRQDVAQETPVPHSGECAYGMRFRFTHFLGVIAMGFVVILPTLLLGALFSGKLAIREFSDGFVDVSFQGVSMEVREYVREDGKKVTLVPMSHVGESKFYETLAQSFPADAVVLMEGVSDKQKLLPNAPNYSKMATLIGAAEQQKVFKPKGTMVNADLDVSEFSPETLKLLKAALAFHTQGLTPETLAAFSQPAEPGLEKRLMDDVLFKRNQHLIKVLHEKLPETQHIIVPWGAAHIPDIASKIEAAGFRVVRQEKHLAIRF